MVEKTLYPSERILEDDYPVHAGYLYVCDGEPTESPVSGTVRDLKFKLPAFEVRRCDIASRFYKTSTAD